VFGLANGRLGLFNTWNVQLGRMRQIDILPFGREAHLPQPIRLPVEAANVPPQTVSCIR
jgi:hypothetical protein